jgi:LacI family transcriptional regulator
LTGRRPVTIKEVAKRAGVSLMTVSAVLNGKSEERRISKVTQLRVEEIARLLDYRPNAIARSLRRKSTNVIGLYSGIGYLNASHPFLAELIGGLQQGCDEHRKDLLLHGTFRGRSVDDIYTELIDGRLDGLIVQAPLADPLVDRLMVSHLPVIAVVDAIPSVPSVAADDATGGRMLADHLIMLGHRRLLYLGPSAPIVSAVRRRAAFFETAAQHGLNVSEWSGHPMNNLAGTPVEAWLSSPVQERPTAVVCWADSAAYEFLEYCQQRGLRVPEDVAVTGFDGFPLPPAAVRRLTTVRAPWGEVARTAVALLVDHLDGREIPHETVIPVEFVRGDTA